ncbi:cysteine hydrolase [Kineosporia mesophila]|uniref:Cysteine hydrolase n=1 Tax=Kineosporia mesophila TaxID=566012 RepID=A0ABP7A4K8_9ACTN|nr:isochorismatase family cysteine hydrolase [Kineosporia mesophila]MCD5353846.1 cysteine hydrolase [Kineosporia mesophila]
MNISGKTALVVVDFQGGDLSGPAAAYGRGQLVKAQTMVAECRAQGVPVVWIQEVHKSHLTDIGRELDGSEGPHCIEGNPGTEIATGLGPVGEEFHIRKRRYSSFFATELDIVLKSYGVENLILIGGFTDICILYTSVDAHQRDFHIRVATDLTAGSSVQAHDDALKMINYLQRDALVTSDEVMSWLGELAPVA